MSIENENGNFTKPMLVTALSSELVTKAKNYAIKCHTETNHKYDGKPYETHLQMVVDYAMIVCEVSELRNEKRIITQERVIKAPQIWLPADRFIPEFNGYYLCYIVRNEECANITKGQDQVFFLNTKWSVLENEKVTHWMIVEDPKIKK